MIMNIASLDLNLLLAFDAVMRERHVTKAAQSLFMTQPALSNALNRLRHTFKDELFVRSPKGMRPTPKALELAAPIRHALQTIDNAINPPKFDPATSEHTFKLVCNDHFVQTALPSVIGQLSTLAPGVDLRLYPAQGNSYQLLDGQSIDFGISNYGQPPDRFAHQRLFGDEYVVLMHREHPLSAFETIPLAEYAAASHMLVTLSGDPVGFIDKALQVRGKSRRVALTLNQFSSAPDILERSPLLLTLPAKLATIYTQHFDLVTRTCPLQAPPAYTETLMIWHKRLSVHPANEWFRGLVKQVCKEKFQG